GSHGLVFASQGQQYIEGTCWGFPVQGFYAYQFFNHSKVLALRGGNVTVQSPMMNAAGGSQLVISVDQLRGFHPTFLPDDLGGCYLDEGGRVSERPDYNDDLYLEFLGSDGNWHLVERLRGDGAQNERLDRRDQTAYVIEDSRAFHNGLRLRYRFPTGAGPYGTATDPRYFDWWYVDNITVEMIGRPVPYLLQLSNVLTDSPSIGGQTLFPANVSIADAAINPAGTRLLLHGMRTGAVQWGSCTAPAADGIYVASIAVNAGNACSWLQQVDDDSINGGTVDAGGIAVD